MTENQTIKKNSFLYRWLPFLVAFLAPIFILIAIYILRDVFPIGNQMYLRSDMYHQYAPFLKQFADMLKSGTNLEFNWNIGLGNDFVSTYAYYLASPLNWIVLIFPSNWIPEIMSSFIILKSGLMSLSFAYYLSKKFNKTNLLCAAFGIFYALSSYMAAYNWNVMWLDCLVLFPLIILGLERLVKENKGYLYTICIGICILSNYYISIMIAFFLVFYFAYLMITEGKVFGKSNVFKKIGHFVLSSLIGGLIGAVCALPALCTLFDTASGNFSFPKVLTSYYSFVEFASQALMNQEVTMIKGYVPNIYCTVLAFALIPLYWIGKKINIKEKIGKTILLAILVFSFTFNIPAYIWHGFHFPNSLRARHSFIYIFLILLICYEVTLKIKEYSKLSIIICFCIAIGVVIALKFLNDTDKLPLNVFCMCIGFLIAYGIILLLIKGVPLFKFVFMATFCALAIAETYINFEDTGLSTTNRTYYVQDNESISELLNSEKEGFYRTEKVKRKTKNDGSWNSYKSASIFSSTTAQSLSTFYKKFGMQSSTNSFSFYGHTPLMAQILNVKYLISEDELNDSIMNLCAACKNESNETGLEYLYEYKFDTSLGYLVNEDFDKNFITKTNNPFIIQNQLVNALVGAKPIFENDESIINEKISILVKRDGRQFVYLEDKIDAINVEYYRDGKKLKTKNISSLEGPIIVDLGDVCKDDVVQITSADEDFKRIRLIPANMDMDAFVKVSSLISKNKMDVTEYKGNYVKASVHVDKNKTMLFTSIPADKGWSVYVDGKKSTVLYFKDAFLQVPLTQGEHIVEFKYHAPGFIAGLIISIIAILSLIIKKIYCKIQKFE